MSILWEIKSLEQTGQFPVLDLRAQLNPYHLVADPEILTGIRFAPYCWEVHKVSGGEIGRQNWIIGVALTSLEDAYQEHIANAG